MGELLAARGYRFVLQAVRGTDGSEGDQSFFAERDDGRATAEWLTTQPWWDGRLGTYGSSYMGFTQWALASTAPSYLRAMVIALSSTHSSWYLGGTLALELMINWDLSALNFLHPERGGFGMDIEPDAIDRKQRMLLEAFDHLPLGDALLHVAGENHPLFEQQIAHPSSDDPHWAPFDFAASSGTWNVPTLLIDAGSTPRSPACATTSSRSGRAVHPRLSRIGGGGHLDGGGEGAAEATFAWYERHLRGADGQPPMPPVSVHVQGDGGVWQTFDEWPPPATPTRWYLHDGGGLSTESPSEGTAPSTYRYDPADPTPSLGGTGLMTGGAVDNTALESRADVLVFSGDPLDAPLEVIGPVQADLVVARHSTTLTSSCASAMSIPTAAASTSATDYNASSRARSSVATTAPSPRRCACGRRSPLRVRPPAPHPGVERLPSRVRRNLGTGEPPATATELRVANRSCTTTSLRHHR